MKPSKIVSKICAELGPHLVKKNYLQFRPKNATPSWGACYVAAESLFHLWGKQNGFTPMMLKYKVARGFIGTHWFLEHRPSGLIIDITADQFDKTPDYKAALPCGFMTKQPSKRAQQIIDAVLQKS